MTMLNWTSVLVLATTLLPHIIAQSSYGEEKSEPHIQCYECTSYMLQCKETVDHSLGYVYSMECKSNCFVRLNEDGATYRGCADHFTGVKGMDLDYVGCRNLTWNNREMTWCMCDTNLCNEMSMDLMSTSQSSYGRTDIYDNVYNAGNSVESNNGYYYDQQPADDTSKVDSGFADEQYYYEQKPQTSGGSELSSSRSRSYMDHFAREGPQDSQYTESFPNQNEADNYNKYNQYETEANNKYQNFNYNDDIADEKSGNYYGNEVSSESSHSNQYGQQDGDYYPYQTDPTVYGEKSQQTTDDMKAKPDYVSSKLAAKIQCLKTGYYQNPNDCRQFVACLMDPYSQTPIMHVMTCPEGLVFDNKKKICLEYSTTCNGGSHQAEYVNADRHASQYGDDSYQKVFDDIDNYKQITDDKDNYQKTYDNNDNKYQTNYDDTDKYQKNYDNVDHYQKNYDNNDNYQNSYDSNEKYQSSEHRQNEYGQNDYLQQPYDSQNSYSSGNQQNNDDYQNAYNDKYDNNNYIRN